MAYVLCRFCDVEYHEDDEHECRKGRLKEKIVELENEIKDCHNKLEAEREPEGYW